MLFTNPPPILLPKDVREVGPGNARPPCSFRVDGLVVTDDKDDGFSFFCNRLEGG
jgi:hypothetical protein